MWEGVTVVRKCKSHKEVCQKILFEMSVSLWRGVIVMWEV